MEMSKQYKTIKIRKKNVMVGLGKSIAWATAGYVVTAGLYSVFGDKTFGEIVTGSLQPRPGVTAIALCSIALSAYGYAGEDSVNDWLREQSEEDLFN